MAALDDSQATVRVLACWSLGMAGADATAAVAKLSAALGSPEADLRRMAAWAVGSIGPTAMSAEPELQALLQDPEAEVRAEAEEALQKLHGTYSFGGAMVGTP